MLGGHIGVSVDGQTDGCFCSLIDGFNDVWGDGEGDRWMDLILYRVNGDDEGGRWMY